VVPARHHQRVEAEPIWDDSTAILNLLVDIRDRTIRIEALLLEDDEEDEEEP
jgi:hypothetical protein